MNLSDLSPTAQAHLSDFARRGCVILTRKRGERGGHSIRPIPIWNIISGPVGVRKLVTLLDDGWRIVQR